MSSAIFHRTTDYRRNREGNIHMFIYTAVHRLAIHVPNRLLPSEYNDCCCWLVNMKGVGVCVLLFHFKTFIRFLYLLNVAYGFTKSERWLGVPHGLTLPPLRTSGDQAYYRKSSLLLSKRSVEMTSYPMPDRAPQGRSRSFASLCQPDCDL